MRTPRLHHAQILALLGIALAPATANAISVTLTVERWAFCGQPVGILLAEVSGGESPYTFNWYRWVAGSYQPYCMDCGPVLEDLSPGSYMVSVIDALFDEDQATEEVMSFDESNVSPDASDILGFPYITDGEAPFLRVAWWPLSGHDYVCVSVDNAEVWPLTEEECDYGGGGSPGKWFRPWSTTGGTITFTVGYAGQECVFQVPYLLPQPAAVPPAMQVLEVEGSCANAATGRAVITVSDVVFAYNPAPLDPWPWNYRIWKNGPGSVPQGGFPAGEMVQITGDYIFITPGTTFVELEGLLPGTHQFFASIAGVFQSPASYDWSYDNYSMVAVTIPNLGPTCGELKGRVFVDANLNCSSQINEAGVPGVVMEVLPGPLYTNTVTGGSYGLVLPNGSYTVQAHSSVVEEHCSGDPLPFTITGAPAGTTVDHPMVSLVPFDGRITQTSGAARPGFEYLVGMAVRNLTPSLSGAVTVTMAFDPVLDFLSATPAPSNVSGNVLTWSQPQLTAFQSRSFTVRFQVPPDVGLLGTDLITTATLTAVQPDANPDNNTSTLVRTITGAYDPNDKLATTSLGSGSQWLVGQDEWIDYTIRFQNTGTDTAFHVIITDTLPSNLDPATLEMGTASHPFTWELQGAGVLKFKFLGILLPDSIVNEPRSHGFVGFRIRPRLPLLPGDQIENIANIYFDFNPPVITEPSVLVATTGTGVEQIGIGALSIQPNPTDGLLIVRMTGDDLRPGMLRVRSMDGRMVMEQRMTGTEVRMDVLGLANGAYVLELLNDNGPRSVARFVKQ